MRLKLYLPGGDQFAEGLVRLHKQHGRLMCRQQLVVRRRVKRRRGV